MNRWFRRTSGFGLLALTACLGAAALAGPLDPPAGPIAPTGRTLDELYTAIQSLQSQRGTPITSLPITITQSGAYYLAANIQLGGSDGITISADDVTLDLNGRTITGNFTGTAGTLRGIVVTQGAGSAPRRNITIRNGTVRDFTSVGIDATNVVAGRFENLNLFNNGRSGLIAGEACVIVQCVARSNRETGIVSGLGNTLENCTAVANGARPNTINTNGFIISAGGTVRGCSAVSNQGTGFNCASQVTIVHCEAVGNDISGIVVANECLVESNNSNSNGQNVANGGGVTVTGIANRIVNNNCTGNDLNFSVAGGAAAGGNFLARNSASRPTGGVAANNYSIGANNHFGQVLTLPGTGFQDNASFANIIY